MRKLFAVLVICMVLSMGCAPVAAFIATVTPAPTPLPQLDLLADSTCAKPCVLGITPGDTTQSDAWMIVKSNKQLSNCTQASQGRTRWIECSFGACDISSLSVAFSGHPADMVTIAQRPVKTEQIIQRYGQPDALAGSGRFLPDEPPNSRAILAYDRIHAIVTLELKPTDTYEITPDTLVEAVTFWSKEEYAGLTADMLVHWKGYGVYGP